MVVYLLMKHPTHPYNAQHHLKAGECLGVYADKAEPQKIADEKNSRRPSYLYSVQRKIVKATP